MKNIFKNIEQEKNRILEMHRSAIKNSFLLIEESTTNDCFPTNFKTIGEYKKIELESNSDKFCYWFFMNGSNTLQKDVYDNEKGKYLKEYTAKWKCENGRLVVYNLPNNNPPHYWDINQNGFVPLQGDGQTPTSTYGDVTRSATGSINQNDTTWDSITTKNKVMMRGSKGPLVKEVQKFLINKGYTGTTENPITPDVQGCKTDVSKCDGAFGPNTASNVTAYQTNTPGLQVDGKVGKQTAKAMGFI